MAGAPKTPDAGDVEAWSHAAGHFIVLMQMYPLELGLLFLAIIIILVLVPGGVGPAWVKYRGAKEALEQDRDESVEKTLELIGKRAQRRARGRGKGKR